MQLADYILENIEPILGEWEKFARTILPVTSEMDQKELRDHAEVLLRHIAKDMKGPQSPDQQQVKSQGRRVFAHQEGDNAAETHAGDRLRSGFTLMEMISEYRALRASVIRLWTKQIGEANRENLEELTRFNEAIDEAMSDSTLQFTASLDYSRDLLLGVLGHDLRDPLAAIVMYATYLTRSERLDGDSAKAVTRLFATASRMRLMVADLLDYASTRLGSKLPVHRVPMQMDEVCRRVIDEVEISHPDAPLRMHAGGVLAGEWDPIRVSQLLANLIGNAVEHGASGATVDITLGGTEEQISIAVHNSGAPIPPDEQKKIFEPLVRGSRELATPTSVGLGLYISQEIARAHGGAIAVESSAGEGTTFTVSLPRYAPSS